MQLPTKKELPEYYETINQPIDFNRIRKNLKKGHYDTVDALGSDIRLLCRNAQTFNMEDSDIYRDSRVLWAVWERLKAQAIASNAASEAGPSGSSTTTTTTAVPVTPKVEPPKEEEE